MIKENRPLWRLLVAVVLVAALLSGCGGDKKKTDPVKSFTIGVLVQTPTLVPVFDGFKASMAEVGYIEGKNVVYVYNGPTGSADALKTEAQNLKSKNPDLLFAIGTPAAQAAKDALAGMKTPVVFAPVINPVELGFVESFQNPGGNFTGINSTDTVAKSLEWMLQIVPGIKRVYVPNNTQDPSSVKSVQTLTDTGKTMGIEVVSGDGATPDELDAITKNIPEGVDAVFMARSGAIGARIANVSQAANARRIPVFSSDIGALVTAGALMGYGPGYFEMGQQAAHLADQILKGSDPATLPVENAETYLGINLQTAQTIGIQIPNNIVSQAEQIIRPSS